MVYVLAGYEISEVGKYSVEPRHRVGQYILCDTVGGGVVDGFWGCGRVISEFSMGCNSPKLVSVWEVRA